MNDKVTIRLNIEDKKLFENISKLYDCSISATIKRLAIEKLEDEIDINEIKKYEKTKESGKLKTRPINRLWKNLCLDD